MSETRTDQAAAPAAGTLAASRRIAAYLLLLAVLGCVAAASWAGLYGFARTSMHWSAGHAVLVPVALDIAAMTCALLALDSIAKGEVAPGFRVLTAAFVALSAFVNWRHSIATGNVAEQIFFPAMSVLAYALVHEVFAKYRREVTRDLAGAAVREQVDKAPRLGVASWARFPRRAFDVWSDAIAVRLATAGKAIEGRRGEPVGVLTGAPETPASGGPLGTLTQAEAIRRAIAEVGTAPRAVVGWLAANGRPGVPASRVHDVIRRDRATAPKLHAVTGVERGAAGRAQ